MSILERKFGLRERDGIALAAREWPASNPRAVLVVAHGMGEHSARYLAPLTPLIENGITIYALDHRGHGASVGEGDAFGDYGPGGYAGVVSDLAALIDTARREHPCLPLILFGHSMGSMIAQGYVLDHSDRIDGLALSGSAAVDVVAAAGAENPELFGALNQPFEPGRTGFEWLSRDETEVDAYMADPWCGFALEPASFGDLLAQAPRLSDPVELSKIRKGLPIYITSGDQDPLVGMLDALSPLILRYTAQGLPVTRRIYAGARHEILNELNRREVVRDLAKWADQIPAMMR